MIRRPPISTLTDTLFPYTTLVRSAVVRVMLADLLDQGPKHPERAVRAAFLLHQLQADLPFVLHAAMLAGQLIHAPLERLAERSEEHTSELQSLMRISYAVFCLTNTNKHTPTQLLVISTP